MNVHSINANVESIQYLASEEKRSILRKNYKTGPAKLTQCFAKLFELQTPRINYIKFSVQ